MLYSFSASMNDLIVFGVANAGIGFTVGFAIALGMRFPQRRIFQYAILATIAIALTGFTLASIIIGAYISAAL